MKVVHIVRQYAPSVGGLEDAVGNLCRHLAKKPDVEVRVVTLDRLFSDPSKKLPAQEIVEGIEVTRIPYFGSKRYPVALSVLKTLRNADIIHVHAIDFFFDFLAWTKFIHRKKLVASTHGGFFHTAFAARLKKIYFQTITRLSCLAYGSICGSSDNDCNTFRAIAGDKVVSIENGVNIEKWRDSASQSAARTMIFVGRWSDNKRVPLLIDLLAALRKQNSAWRLIVAGVEGHETVQSLLEKAKASGVQEALAIHLKPSDAEIGKLMGGASYIASVSSYEGFGLTIVEGLSAGLSPILTPLPPFQKIVDQLGFGSIVDADDLEKSATAIEAAHRAGEASYVARRARCLALSDRYAWPDTAQRFYEIYQKV